MSQTNFSYEDFILTQVHKALKKSSFISSSWERLAEKSSSWKCYVYNNAQEFICLINMTFNPNFDKNKLIPIGLDVVIDSAEKKVNDDNDWDEIVPDWELGMDESNSESNSENNGENNSQVNLNQNNNYQYISSYDLNHKESLKVVNRKIINLLTKSKAGFWMKYI